MVMDFNELQYTQKRSPMKTIEWGNVLGRFAGEWMALITSEDDPAQQLTEMAKDIDLMLAEASRAAADKKESADDD